MYVAAEMITGLSGASYAVEVLDDIDICADNRPKERMEV